MSDNKRIAKNTLFLYIRMIIIMLVTLYTSRVVLEKLGIDDYGIYNVVGGVVGMLSFLNGTLSIGTSRFITFELGTGNFKKLQNTFSTAFYAHLGLAIIMAILLESVVLWFVYNKLIIPPNRFNAALWVYHISILNMIISITQVPYTSSIMAHEEMGVYAYVSIFEAIAKLAVVFLLVVAPVDKLVWYAILLAAVQFVIAIYYRIFCIRKYIETHLKRIFCTDIFKEMMSFSGWNILATITETIKLQGVIILMNLFFLPAIVGAQAFANQLAGAVMQFINNFSNAINPQIIKLYAVGDYEASKKLRLRTTIYIFDLVLLFGLPAIFLMEQILDIWLVKVPPYAVVFSQWILIQRIFSVHDGAFYIPLMAAGKVRENSVLCTILAIFQLTALYIILKLGGNVMWIQYVGVLLICMFSFIIKPYLLYKEVNYSLYDIYKCLIGSMKVLLLSLIVPIFGGLYVDKSSIFQVCIYLIFMVIGVIISSYLVFSRDEKDKIHTFMSKQIRKLIPSK